MGNDAEAERAVPKGDAVTVAGESVTVAGESVDVPVETTGASLVKRAGTEGVGVGACDVG